MQSDDAPRIERRGPFIIHHYSTIGSTNDVLKSMPEAPEFLCLVADEQTAGRGRRARTWHSAPGEGLYLSVLFRPAGDSDKVTLVSLLAAIAVAETLAEMGLRNIDVKWPNDVLAGDRKICGILVEGASSGPGRMRLVVGIGVNLNHRGFPEDLALTATSFLIETGQGAPVGEVRDRLLDRLLVWYDRWRDGRRDEILERWRELSSYAKGKRVIVTLDGERQSGVTAGLTEAGALIIETPSGEMRIILAGEVTSLREDSV